jgi:hypothetical protein
LLIIQTVDYQRSNIGPDDDVLMPASSPPNRKITQEIRANDSDFSNALESEGDGESEPDPDEVDPRELQLRQKRQREVTAGEHRSSQEIKQGMQKFQYTELPPF